MDKYRRIAEDRSEAVVNSLINGRHDKQPRRSLTYSAAHLRELRNYHHGI